MDSSFIRIVVTACLTLIGAAAQAQPASADAYPVKTVRFVVGYAPGGSTDIVARLVAQRLSEQWGTQVVVENRPGADTIIATEESYIKAGRLKPLVVFSATRSAVLPQTPTIAEQGFPDLQSEYWIGIMGPAKLPAAVVAKLNTNINAVLNLPGIRERFKQIGVDPLGGSAE